MKTGFLRILGLTTASLVVTVGLQTAAVAGSGNVYSYFGKNVTADDIVARFVDDCAGDPNSAACGHSNGASTARAYFPFRSRGIRIHGQDAKRLETDKVRRKPVRVSTAGAGRGADKKADVKSKAPQKSSGGCPDSDSSVALPINFSLNSAILEVEAYKKLHQMAQAMKSATLGKCKFTVEGHTDASGGTQLNLQLSKRRAYAVREFLVSMAVDSARLVPVGKGEAEPLPNSKPSDPENRRVQFRIVRN